MSLVELLVVIAIIGMLLGLLLPAVQQSREAARRVQCLNNLRQMAIALDAYHGSFGTFPSGCIERRITPDKSRRQIAWSALLLPFIEQQAVYDSLDLGARSTARETRRRRDGAFGLHLPQRRSRPGESYKRAQPLRLRRHLRPALWQRQERSATRDDALRRAGLAADGH